MREALKDDNFQGRLHVVMVDANMTVSDLARWFGRPHPTVSGWCKGHQPGGAPGDVERVYDLLDKLEATVKRKEVTLLPVPTDLTPSRRLKWLAQCRRLVVPKKKR